MTTLPPGGAGPSGDAIPATGDPAARRDAAGDTPVALPRQVVRRSDETVVRRSDETMVPRGSRGAVGGWRPKLVALDLDGTMVGYGGMTPTPAVVAAVARVVESGVPVVVATGRAVTHALDAAVALGLHGITLVCTNGAVVYDGDVGAVVHQETVDMSRAAHALAERLPGAGFAVERGIVGFAVTPGLTHEFLVGGHETVDDLAELVARPTTRLVCAATEHGVAALARAAAESLDPAVYSWELGYTAWMDVMAAGVSKATGIARVCAALGVDASGVLALGDGSNDLALFGWAGCAVAMGQSAPELFDVADLVTDPVDADGAATALGWWF
ncbi:MAG TPA: HAD family hydrolase [Cryptosporangiaceae bacterium]|nr:HAD family hydrolase [Cryptosporangiaceae bacterium]